MYSEELKIRRVVVSTAVVDASDVEADVASIELARDGDTIVVTFEEATIALADLDWQEETVDYEEDN